VTFAPKAVGDVAVLLCSEPVTVIAVGGRVAVSRAAPAVYRIPLIVTVQGPAVEVPPVVTVRVSVFLIPAFMHCGVVAAFPVALMVGVITGDVAPLIGVTVTVGVAENPM
jgi:hypothetical protein